MRTAPAVSGRLHVASRGVLLSAFMLAACSGKIAADGTLPEDEDEGSSEGEDGSGGSGGETVDPPKPPIDIMGPGGEKVRCEATSPGRAPLRRLTRVEYDNVIRDVLGDATSPASALPADQIGNGFGNDADALSLSSLHATQYEAVARGIAERATSSAAQLAKLHECAGSAQAANEESCARAIASKVLARLFRRPLVEAEVDDFVGLFRGVRAKLPFASSVAAMLEAALQAPDFLYRVELGEPVPGRSDVRRPNAFEMAARLSFLYWGSAPDEALWQAAATNQLGSEESVRAQAKRMLADPRARAMTRSFFDKLLPIESLTDLERDRTRFPKWNAAVGRLMRQQIHAFLEAAVHDDRASWKQVLTAQHTFMNQELAAFFGRNDVTGDAFRKVAVAERERVGILTTPGIMAGTTHSNYTNPVVRGAYVMHKVLCVEIPLPSQAVQAEIVPPKPDSAPTGRDRYRMHSTNAMCASCHELMDPVGFALEQFDAVGAWRTTENGVTIDSSGHLPVGDGQDVSGPAELARTIADRPEANHCFAHQWLTFALGRTLNETSEADLCIEARLHAAFKSSGFEIAGLLAALATTDAMRFMPAAEESKP